MSTYTSETVTCTFRRWIIPAAEPWGAAAAEVSKAWVEAEREYRDHFKTPNDQALSDNALRFHVRDAEIVIEFTVEGEPT